MLNHNQCFAPSYNGRCKNKSVQNSNHCELHNPKSKKLYIKYKKLSNQAKNIDLNKEFANILDKITYINNCYNLYNKIYEARLKHRKFAIAPNLYDQGHDFQFIDLNNKINKCEEILYKLYESYENDNTSDSDNTNDSNYSNEECDVRNNNSIVIYKKNSMTLSEKIKLNKQYRANKEREINEHVEKYINQNKINIERKNLLICHLCNCISLIFGEDEEIDRTKIVVMISLIMKLESINYFDKNFVPRTCKHPDCKCTISYNLSLGAAYLQDAQCFCQYIELFSEESLKFLFELFLFNKKKILPFVDDINKLHEENNDYVIYINAELIWKNNRLNLRESEYNESDNYVKSKKPSELFAVSRLKNKFYERQLVNNLFS